VFQTISGQTLVSKRNADQSFTVHGCSARPIHLEQDDKPRRRSDATYRLNAFLLSKPLVAGGLLSTPPHSHSLGSSF
jgi:hypothetical protein